MFKVLILLALAIAGVSWTSGTLFAGKLAFTYADYVHLSPEKKDQYIRSVMKLMVELEAQYKKDTRTGNTHSEYFQRYSQLLFSLRSLIIADAQAAPGDWNDHAQKFKSIITSAQSGSVCIYAGWPSTMSGGKCTHPSRSGHARAYLGGGCGQGKVSCNPVIFGYKNKAAKSVFCASVSDESRNSSLDCMQAALRDPPEAGADSKEVRLADLRDRLTPDVVDAVYGFTYKTCVCDAGPAALVKSYQDKIRPHRTCYALMNMVAEIKNGCAPEKFSPLNSNFFQQIKDNLTVQSGDYSCRNQSCELDQTYESFRANYRSAAGNRPEVSSFCPQDTASGLEVSSSGKPNATGNKPSTEAPNTGTADNDEIVVVGKKREPCTAVCTPPETEGGKPSCTFKEGDETVTSTVDPVLGTGEDANKYTIQVRRIAADVTDPDEIKAAPLESVSCELPPKPTAGKLTLSLSLSKKATQVTITAKVGKPGDGGEAKEAKIEWYEMVEATDAEETDDGPDLRTPDEKDSEPVKATEEEDKDDDEVELVKGDVLDGDGTTQTIDRETETFMVCAVASESGFEDSDEECEEIEALSAKDATTGPAQQGPGQMMGPGRTTINSGIR